MGSVLLIFLVFLLSYYVSLRSEFRVLMSVTISSQKRCSVRLYLQLFVEGLMSYLLCCVWLRIVVSNTYYVVLLIVFFVLCTMHGRSLGWNFTEAGGLGAQPP